MEFEKAELDELDLPPEFCHYEDEGCEVATSCLHCHLPRCIYDEYGGRNQQIKSLRAREMRRLLARGKGTKEIAELFGVTQRTVQRVVKRKSEIRISKSEINSNYKNSKFKKRLSGFPPTRE